MYVAFAIKKLLDELFEDHPPHSTVIAAVIISATIAECVEYVVAAREREMLPRQRVDQ